MSLITNVLVLNAQVYSTNITTELLCLKFNLLETIFSIICGCQGELWDWLTVNYRVHDYSNEDASQPCKVVCINVLLINLKQNEFLKYQAISLILWKVLQGKHIYQSCTTKHFIVISISIQSPVSFLNGNNSVMFVPVRRSNALN